MGIFEGNLTGMPQENVCNPGGFLCLCGMIALTHVPEYRKTGLIFSQKDYIGGFYFNYFPLVSESKGQVSHRQKC